MPVVEQQHTAGGFWALWRTDETEEYLFGRFSKFTPVAAELQYLSGLRNPRRRCEWLAWHVMVRELLGTKVETAYSSDNTPLLKNHPGHISVSHTGDYVALYYSPLPCGIDLERTARDFSKAAPRFLSVAEKDVLCNEDPFSLSLVWCAKEAAYKLARRPALDFSADIFLKALDRESRTMLIALSDGTEIPMAYRSLHGLTLVYTSQP
ncbi:MAG: 4'-phosphopantetheinyl transferase superfamily protein [Rikenellaceae bacterium]|jgi:4'-phosphopantetheinyl transferase EntD|nr:4'-phosphopantetheinyl transferase superfamily protein [Rikenellaceae bacterium]